MENCGCSCGDRGRHGNAVGRCVLVHPSVPPGRLWDLLWERGAAAVAGRSAHSSLARRSVFTVCLPQQSDRDVTFTSTCEEAEPLETVSVVLVVLSTDHLLEDGGAASSLTH